MYRNRVYIVETKLVLFRLGYCKLKMLIIISTVTIMKITNMFRKVMRRESNGSFNKICIQKI